VRGTVGRVDAAMLDRIAYWNAGAPPYRRNELATDMSFRGAFGAGNYPRIQAYLSTAMHDATVAAWDSNMLSIAPGQAKPINRSFRSSPCPEALPFHPNVRRLPAPHLRCWRTSLQWKPTRCVR
jgi:hypothetical protein